MSREDTPRELSSGVPPLSLSSPRLFPAAGEGKFEMYLCRTDPLPEPLSPLPKEGELLLRPLCLASMAMSMPPCSESPSFRRSVCGFSTVAG